MLALGRAREKWREQEEEARRVECCGQKTGQNLKIFQETKEKSCEELEQTDVDSGYAWVVLIVIFFISASTFGTARAYGLIFERLARDGLQSRTAAAMPFTLMGACENMAGPMSGYLLSCSQNSWRLVVFLGCLLLTLGHLFAACLVDSQLGQLLSLGLMCGLGLSLVTISFFQINNAYFVRYRSTAFGIGLTGAAVGAFYISPLCQLLLEAADTSACYLALALILLPNVPLSLLLKPKLSPVGLQEKVQDKSGGAKQANLESINPNLELQKTKTHTKHSEGQQVRIRSSIKRVLKLPMFHLIWPTQLLFCWFNFVFGMIIVDLGRDRGLEEPNLAHLPPIWAAGQLVGRLLLGPLVDTNYFSYKTWTVLCFGSISVLLLALNLAKNEQFNKLGPVLTSSLTIGALFLMLVFILSMFIALLYILLNGLIAVYVQQQLQPLCIGLSSFVGSFFLLPRANVIGYYRDTIGNYDSMISSFAWLSLGASLGWLLAEPLGHWLKTHAPVPKWFKNELALSNNPAASGESECSNVCHNKLLELSAIQLNNSLLNKLEIKLESEEHWKEAAAAAASCASSRAQSELRAGG